MFTRVINCKPSPTGAHYVAKWNTKVHPKPWNGKIIGQSLSTQAL